MNAPVASGSHSIEPFEFTSKVAVIVESDHQRKFAHRALGLHKNVARTRQSIPNEKLHRSQLKHLLETALKLTHRKMGHYTDFPSGIRLATDILSSDMRIGLNSFLFTSNFANGESELLQSARLYGAEAIELAIGEPEVIDSCELRDALHSNSFSRPILCGMFTEGRNLRGNLQEAACAEDYLLRLIELAVKLEAPLVCGPLYAETGVTLDLRPDEREAMHAILAKRLRPICEAAHDAGVTLAMEPLNRFETDCINTLAEGAALIEQVNHPALRLHIDTFHMHIEESDSCTAIATHGSLIAHVHASANHRGELHRCQIDWPAVLRGLHAIGYAGDIIIESFSTEDPAMARALCIWRPLFQSREELAREGLKLLRQTWQKLSLPKPYTEHPPNP